MRIALIIILITPVVLFAETAADIIKKVDENENFKTQKFSALMTIQKGSRTLKKSFYGYGEKDGEKSFMTFTNNEDRGVKYLKIDKELWIYFPDADDIMKISGHMLRQGMMGSDISYEDMLESSEFEKKYSYELLEDQQIKGINCYVIDCTAKTPDASYAKQKLFIDKKFYVPHRIEMFAKGGRLIKIMDMADFKTFAGKTVPMTVTVEDKRKRNSKTVITFMDFSFDIVLPDGIFTRRSLRR